jgi:hypothetical protein
MVNNAALVLWMVVFGRYCGGACAEGIFRLYKELAGELIQS